MEWIPSRRIFPFNFLNVWTPLCIINIVFKICMQVKKQHLEPDMKKQTGSKSGKE